MEAVREKPQKKRRNKNEASTSVDIKSTNSKSLEAPKNEPEETTINDKACKEELVQDATTVPTTCETQCITEAAIDLSEAIKNNDNAIENYENTAIQVADEAEDVISYDCSEEISSAKSKAENEMSSLDKFLDKNKQILYTLDNLDSIPAQCADVHKTKSVSSLQDNETKILEDIQIIKPYTEQQLNALYYNGELDLLEDFTAGYIESELKGLHIKNHYLYELLSNYLKSREKITGNILEIEQLRKEYGNLLLELWSLDATTVVGRATCQDGRVVQASQEFNRSVFNRSAFENIIRVLGKIQKLVYENHVLYCYSAEDLRLQIELYIKQIIENVLKVTQIDKKSPVSLVMTEQPAHLQPFMSELRTSISILFGFQRTTIKDGKFIDDLRGWLTQLAAVLIRAATYQDHLFLMHHILRCPAGVSTWASAFIQAPLHVQTEEPFGNYQINHILSLISVILSPIKARKDFLKDIVHCQNSESNWVLVDSDGEEDEDIGVSLRENDLVALLNQLPLGNMFRCILLINRSDGKDKYDTNVVTDQHILRFFAFSSVLLKLLHRGLETYSQPKYNQFSKRLSRFIRHVVQYTTDQWELFLKKETMTDRAMIQRLQVEYDGFFLRAIYYLYSSQKLRAWQFLAVVPYNIVTTRTLWKIYYFLHMPDEKAEDIMNFSLDDDFRRLIWDKELRSRFEEKLCSLEDAEIYYLLNTFANMALARTEADIDFIYSAAMDILQVGFVSQITQDSCSKSARILLTHLTSKYPCLLSNILKTVEENIERIGSFALYLYEELPLTIWAVTDDDLGIIKRLLLNFPVNTDQTKLARMILSRLNWNFLPFERHCDTAVLVLKAVDQEPAYLPWGWQTILRLKLHISDHHFNDLGRVQDLERCEILLKGVRENQPLPCFVAILMTSWGHLVPLICSKGLAQIVTLLNHQKYEAVLFALYQIMPVFITCQECIINCDKFQDILTNLLNADRGYISYAKSFIMTQNTILQQFGNMIETQITNFAYYDLHSPKLLVRLWMNSLVSIPNWNKDSAILYLLDVIIRSAFNYPDSLQIIYENFRELYQASTPKEETGIISMFKWASGSSNSGYSLLSNSLAQYPWLAYIFLEIEHQEKEVKTGLWMELLRGLSRQKGKINVDQAIKTAASNLKLSPFSSNCLCIYRWAQQAMDTQVDHPLLPLLWQKFFRLFLTRLPVTSSADRNCIGDRFFDGMVNFAFLKRIKKKLQETVDFYKTETDNTDEHNPNIQAKEHYILRYNIFQAFLLWLEEPRLLCGNLLLQSLPVQYQPRLLGLIIQENSQAPWYEYLDQNQIVADRALAIKQWRVANFREKSNVNQPLLNPGHGVESSDPVERILRRLTSYDAIKPPPKIALKNVVMPHIDLSGRDEMFKTLKPSFDTIKQFAHNHIINLSEQKALDCRYQELVPQLFTSVLKVIKKKVPCKGKNETVLCSGPGIVILEIQEVKRNERVDREIHINRQTHKSALEKNLESPPMNLYRASVSIQQCVRLLQHRIKTNPETAELGVELFYYILPFLLDETSLYLPAKTLFVGCIEKLGQTHICGFEHEMPRLLQWILKEPNLGGYLAPYFLPSNSATANMLFMYSTINKEMPKKYDTIFALISKFEIEKWLNEKSPNLNQRSQFIGKVIDALSALGYDPPVEALTLHCLYRRHLMSVFQFQFPEHYGEILLHLLKASNGSSDSLIAESVWIDVLNTLARPAKISIKAPLRDQLRQYAQHQKMLAHQELLETAELLARHFTQERLSYGLYGLYPKCRKYMDVFVLLVGMTGHGVIVSMLNTHQGLLGDKLCEKIWPYIRELFGPWLIPYSMHNLKENMAVWIQQLADDRSILLPWIPADTDFAGKMINNFFECVTFVLDTLPASFIILSYVWQWYVTSFAHASVKDHVLIPIHRVFTKLPWNKFWPSLVDLDFMLRVIDQYLPECHSFLGYIFVSISWGAWINSFANAPSDIKNKVYHCFLSLLVKLSVEPNIRKNYPEKARSVIVQAENFDWTAVEAFVFQHIMDWMVMSSNSSVIFKNDPMDLDYRILCLLKQISGYNNPGTDVNKRQIFVKAHIKLLSIFLSKHKNAAKNMKNDLNIVLNGYFNELDAMASTIEETELLTKEVSCVVNIVDIADLAVEVMAKWIESKTYGLVTRSLLKTLGTSVKDYKDLAVLYEATLTSYFNNNVTEEDAEEPTWKKASELLHLCVSKPVEFDQVLIEEGSLLTLNAILLQRSYRNPDKENLLNFCIDWLEKIKIRESLEPKIPLIWFSIINLAWQNCIRDEAATGALLHKFAQVLLQFSEDNGAGKWRLLSAIGLSKSENISLKFICRAMAGYTLAQLPEMKGLPQKVRTTENAPSVVGMPGGNVECPKVLLELDFRQSQGKIKQCAELALAKIQDPENSLHNASSFLWMLLKQFYIKPYLKSVDE